MGYSGSVWCFADFTALRVTFLELQPDQFVPRVPLRMVDRPFVRSRSRRLPRLGRLRPPLDGLSTNEPPVVLPRVRLDTNARGSVVDDDRPGNPNAALALPTLLVCARPCCIASLDCAWSRGFSIGTVAGRSSAAWLLWSPSPASSSCVSVFASPAAWTPSPAASTSTSTAAASLDVELLRRRSS